MASKGPLSPATLANDATLGTLAWANPGNAAASDDSRATALSVAGEETQYLTATDFPFTGGNAIPSGATIDGVMFEVERSALLAATSIRDLEVKAIVGAAPVGLDQVAGVLFPTTDAYQTFGGATSLWGRTWVDTDISSSGGNFGLAFRANIVVPDTARVDHIRCTVYYTEITYVAASSASVDSTGRIVSVVFAAGSSWGAAVDEAHAAINLTTSQHGTVAATWTNVALSNGNLTLTATYTLNNGVRLYNGETVTVDSISQGQFSGTNPLKSASVVNLSTTNGSGWPNSTLLLLDCGR